MKPEVCLSNQVRVAGSNSCCHVCPPGSGVAAACTTSSDTQCEECEQNKSYSQRPSHTETCQPCALCPENSNRLHRCNATQNTICECDKNYYFEKDLAKCELCALCPIGYGSWRECEGGYNTECRRCGDGTFSDRTGLGACRKCRVCPPSWKQVKKCNFRENTICQALGSTTPSLVQLSATGTRPSVEGNGSDVIPVYCALLSAIIIGLVIYVIVVQVRKTRMRKSRSGTLSQLRPLGGSTLHQVAPGSADSGVYLEQEIKPGAKLSPSTRVKDLPPATMRALERAFSGSQDTISGWKSLARQLGYNSSRKVLFQTRANRDNSTPAHYLLSDWSRKHHATVGALQVALHKIGRDDVIAKVFPVEAPVTSRPSFRRSRESMFGDGKMLGRVRSQKSSGVVLGRSVSFNHVQKSSSIDFSAQSEGGWKRHKKGGATRKSFKDKRCPMSVSLPGGKQLLDV